MGGRCSLRLGALFLWSSRVFLWSASSVLRRVRICQIVPRRRRRVSVEDGVQRIRIERGISGWGRYQPRHLKQPLGSNSKSASVTLHREQLQCVKTNSSVCATKDTTATDKHGFAITKNMKYSNI